MSRKFDYLIVGQGLAGTCLAFTLEYYYKKSVLVVDRHAGQHCSQVAAGTFNPLALRTLSSTWRAEEFIPYLHKFFSDFEKYFSTNVLNERTVLRMFKSEEQRSQWLAKIQSESASEFILKEITEEIPGLKGKFGYGKVSGSGNVNIQNLIHSFRQHLIAEDRIYEEELDFNEVRVMDETVHYKEVKSRNIIFCGGIKDGINPYFTNLPFKRTKGEVLIVEIKDFKCSGIVHNNINIVPMGGDKYWVGSTFDWEDESLQVSDSARKKLKEQLENTLSSPFRILDQWVGIRPTVKDRRPLIGRHNKYKNIILFNGLGTRGVMLAPFMSKELSEHLENGQELDKEVDIKRFIGST